jgi:hypothetical protein
MSIKRDQSRREQIMNSGAQLPGDQARADDDVNEDNDSLDTGNFSAQEIEGQQSNPSHQQQVNQSEAQLPGDEQRASNDRRVDAGGDGQETMTGENSPAQTGSRGPDDKFVTSGQAAGGGTPAGGGSQGVHEPGMGGGMTGGTDDTTMAQGAFGGSRTGYGKGDTETSGANTGTTVGGGTAGGMAMGAGSQGGGSVAGQTSGGGSTGGGTQRGMVAGGGIEGSVSVINNDDLNLPEAENHPERSKRREPPPSPDAQEPERHTDDGTKTGGKTVDG